MVKRLGNSLVVQWLRLCALTARALVPSLVKAPTSHSMYTNKEDPIQDHHQKCRDHSATMRLYKRGGLQIPGFKYKD